jgi:CubicO group peptidase (beta-lactamase class C family)
VTEQHYFPSAVEAWQQVAPEHAGFSGDLLAEAVSFACDHETPWPYSFYYDDGSYAPNVDWNESGPWSAVVGPVRLRGASAGMILKGGRIAARWGETDRPDMTFSIAKSYLAVLAGLAVDQGLIADIDAPVARAVAGPLFATEHNRKVTWRHLLQQTSEWQGEMFGKPDQIDHNRAVGPRADNSRKGQRRESQEPGSFYEYNDVRVNLLSWSLLQIFRRPLPEILRERIMDPIGASSTWEWLGYETAWVDIDGQRVQSVPGGGHWGGGLFIGAEDHARFGLLIASGGQWDGRRLLSEDWISSMLSASPALENYGFLWWLNRGPHANKSAPSTAASAVGAGGNVVWIDRDNDLVVVTRWLSPAKFPEFISRLMQARS